MNSDFTFISFTWLLKPWVPALSLRVRIRERAVIKKNKSCLFDCDKMKRHCHASRSRLLIFFICYAFCERSLRNSVTHCVKC